MTSTGNKKSFGNIVATGALVAAMATAATQANALQRGAPQYPIGVDTLYAADYPAIPGLFLFSYGLHYNIGSIRDGQGRSVFNGYRGSVTGIAFKPTIVWDTTIFGARPVTFIVIPLLNRAARADSVNTFAPAPAPANVPFSNILGGGRSSESRFGLGDMTFAQALNWKFSGGWSLNVGLDVYAPTGDYDKNRFFNIGSANAWTFYPNVAVTWRSPENHHLSLKAMYGFATRNAQTDTDIFTASGQSLARYQSGQHLILEGAAGVGITPTVGLDMTAYTLIQTTPDYQNGVKVQNSYTRSLGLGPQLRINVGPGAIAFRYQREFNVRNGPQGDRFWVQFGVPLYVPGAAQPASPIVTKF